MVMLACDADGVAPIRAAIEWTPLQALAGEAPVVLCLIARSMSSTAFIADWDTWREAGVHVLPLYLHAQSSDAGATQNGAATSEGADALCDNDRCGTAEGWQPRGQC